MSLLKTTKFGDRQEPKGQLSSPYTPWVPGLFANPSFHGLPPCRRSSHLCSNSRLCLGAACRALSIALCVNIEDRIKHPRQPQLSAKTPATGDAACADGAVVESGGQCQAICSFSDQPMMKDGTEGWPLLTHMELRDGA